MSKQGKIVQSSAGTSGWYSMKSEPGAWTIQIQNPGGANVTVEATLSEISKNPNPTADEIYPITDLTGIVTGGIFGPITKVRGIRLTTTGAGVVTADILE